jgi:hypothetical protein
VLSRFELDLFCKSWFGSVNEGKATKPQFFVDFGFFLFFPAFFDWATDQTTEPIAMVDDSNDVFSREYVPFEGHVIT